MLKSGSQEMLKDLERLESANRRRKIKELNEKIQQKNLQTIYKIKGAAKKKQNNNLKLNPLNSSTSLQEKSRQKT